MPNRVTHCPEGQKKLNKKVKVKVCSSHEM